MIHVYQTNHGFLDGGAAGIVPVRTATMQKHLRFWYPQQSFGIKKRYANALAIAMPLYRQAPLRKPIAEDPAPTAETVNCL